VVAGNDCSARSTSRLRHDTWFFLLGTSIARASCCSIGDAPATTMTSLVSNGSNRREEWRFLTALECFMHIRKLSHDVATKEHLQQQNPGTMQVPAASIKQGRLDHLLREPSTEDWKRSVAIRCCCYLPRVRDRGVVFCNRELRPERIRLVKIEQVNVVANFS
jgi:hypothetical protein